MPNIDLDHITSDHIHGHWHVKKKFNNDKTKNIFAGIDSLQIQKGSFVAINGEKLEGKISIFREQEIIYNPQVAFFVKRKEVAKAIITRLSTDDDNDQVVHKLTLYFSTGLELTLLKNFQNG